MKLLNEKRVLYHLSLITTIIFSFIFEIGIRIEGSHFLFGFPAQWLGYYREIRFSFGILGLLLDFLVFYFVFWVLNKLRKMLFKSQK